MKYYNVPEIRKHLKEGLDLAEKDEDVYIARKGKIFKLSICIVQEAAREAHAKWLSQQ